MREPGAQRHHDDSSGVPRCGRPFLHGLALEPLPSFGIDIRRKDRRLGLVRAPDVFDFCLLAYSSRAAVGALGSSVRVGDVARDLRCILDGWPVSGRYRARRGMRRGRTMDTGSDGGMTSHRVGRNLCRSGYKNRCIVRRTRHNRGDEVQQGLLSRAAAVLASGEYVGSPALHWAPTLRVHLTPVGALGALVGWGRAS